MLLHDNIYRADANDARRIEEGRGLGEGPLYKPWYMCGEGDSKDESRTLCDPRIGREMHFIRRRDYEAYLRIRWCDDVADIKEYYPLLTVEATTLIARELGIRPYHRGESVMVSTFLITKTNGSRLALDTTTEGSLVRGRMRDLLHVQKEFWNRAGVVHRVIDDSFDPIVTSNLETVLAYWDESSVKDEVSLYYHLVSRKAVSVDFSKYIDASYGLYELNGTGVWNKAVERFGIKL